MKIEAATRLKARRTQDWYSRMTPEQRTAYLKKYPGTKFHDKTTLAVPEEDPYSTPKWKDPK
jgi:hypothetical protein